MKRKQKHYRTICLRDGRHHKPAKKPSSAWPMAFITTIIITLLLLVTVSQKTVERQSMGQSVNRLTLTSQMLTPQEERSWEELEQARLDGDWGKELDYSQRLKGKK